VQGRIYISGAFTTVNPSNGRVNKDPHFWTMPPAWGICRTDFRKAINIGEYAFLVFPKDAVLPQMIYGYLRVSEKITHVGPAGVFGPKPTVLNTFLEFKP
jgi:hypothetical protein